MGFLLTEVYLSEWMRISMYEKDPYFEGYSIVYCRSSVRKLRKLMNPSACDLSRKSPIPSSTKCLHVLGGSLYMVRAVFSKIGLYSYLCLFYHKSGSHCASNVL